MLVPPDTAKGPGQCDTTKDPKTDDPELSNAPNVLTRVPAGDSEERKESDAAALTGDRATSHRQQAASRSGQRQRSRRSPGASTGDHSSANSLVLAR